MTVEVPSARRRRRGGVRLALPAPPGLHLRGDLEMSNFNKVLLLGRLTRDPELRYTPQGTPVVDIGLAINREYTVGTERRKETTFVDVTLWKRQAEVVSQYLKKGAPIFIEGRLSLDSWEQDGQKRSKLRVVGETFQFV